jgi:GTPase SAR1 family protein
MADVGSIQQAKLVLLGDMGAGKSSLVLRFVKGQFFDYQVLNMDVAPFSRDTCLHVLFYWRALIWLNASSDECCSRLISWVRCCQ